MENYPPLAATEHEGCCIFPSVFLRAFLAAGVRRLHARAGAVRGVASRGRACRTAAHLAGPGASLPVRLCFNYFPPIETPLARYTEGSGRTRRAPGTVPNPSWEPPRPGFSFV